MPHIVFPENSWPHSCYQSTLPFQQARERHSPKFKFISFFKSETSHAEAFTSHFLPLTVTVNVSPALLQGPLGKVHSAWSTYMTQSINFQQKSLLHTLHLKILNKKNRTRHINWKNCSLMCTICWFNTIFQRSLHEKLKIFKVDLELKTVSLQE